MQLALQQLGALAAAAVAVAWPAPTLAQPVQPKADALRFTLICRASAHAQTASKTIAIDYGGKTVDGFPATIAPQTISWTTREKNESAGRTESWQHVVDRVDGTYRSYAVHARSVGIGSIYECAKAPVSSP